MAKSNVFQLIDFDRTLFDTAAFARAIAADIDEADPGLGTELALRSEAAYREEKTFFLFRYLRKEKGSEWVEEMIERVVARYDTTAFLMPGMQERLAVAQSTGDGTNWGILTYGDTADQLMKLRIAGLAEARICITRSPDKAALIAGWKNDDGSFTLPESFGGGTYQRLTFEDDKLRAFHNLPDGVDGIWITSDERAQQRLNDGGFAHVTPVPSLIDSTRLVKAVFRQKQ